MNSKCGWFSCGKKKREREIMTVIISLLLPNFIKTIQKERCHLRPCKYILYRDEIDVIFKRKHAS